jgi:hypothetical protein
VSDLTLTQAELDQRISDATAAAVQAATAKFADYETLQTQLAELQRSQESEVERQVREAREAALAEVPTQVQAATAAAKTSLITAELRSWAQQYAFKYPEDVIEQLREHKDLEVTADFKVKGAEKLVKDLAAKRPEWLVPSGSYAPGRPTNTPGDGLREETPEQEAQRKQRMRQVMGVGARTF